MLLLFFFWQDQQKIYDAAHSHASHHHSGLGYHGDSHAPAHSNGGANAAAPSHDAAPASPHEGSAPAATPAAEDPVAKARAIAAMMGLTSAVPSSGGESLKRKLGADVGGGSVC